MARTRASDPEKLIKRVREVGRKLASAQPYELAIGNIVRRVLGLIRDEQEETRGDSDLSGFSSEADADSRPQTPAIQSPRKQNDASPKQLRNGLDDTLNSVRPPIPRPPLMSSHTGYGGQMSSMLNILSVRPTSTPNQGSPLASGTATPNMHAAAAGDLRAEIMEGISEVIDELEQSDDQIAAYALEHLHTDEVVLTYGASMTVQRFLLKAASKRKITVIYAEAYPIDHKKVHSFASGNLDGEAEIDEMTREDFQKPLTAAGVSVIVIPDAAVPAMMSRAHKVILATNAVMANGGLLATSGARGVARAARMHRVPVLVVTATFRLSPLYPYDPDEFLEFGAADDILKSDDEDLSEVEVDNPLTDYVEPDSVDLFVTNLGGFAPSYLYRIVKDQYHAEDIEL